MLVSGVLYDDNLKTICTVYDKVEVHKNHHRPYWREFSNCIDYEFRDFLLNKCDFIVVHNYGADIPAIAKAYKIEEEELKKKTLDTFVSCMQILGKQEDGFYSLANLYKNLISYDAWLSPDKKSFIFGAPPFLGHLLEITFSRFDYFGLTHFREHHPLFDAILTFLLFIDIKCNYEQNLQYRSFSIEG